MEMRDWHTRAAVAAAEARTASEPSALRAALRRLAVAIKGLEKSHARRELVQRYSTAHERGTTRYANMVVERKTGAKGKRKRKPAAKRKRKTTSKRRKR